MNNVFGEPLKPCCYDPITGYFRDGFCKTDQSDFGQHTVCAIMTDKFLAFSKKIAHNLFTLSFCQRTWLHLIKTV